MTSQHRPICSPGNEGLCLILICPNFMEGYSLADDWSKGSCLTKPGLRLGLRSNLDIGRFLLPSMLLGVVSFKCHKMSFLTPENLSFETVKLWGRSVFEIFLSLLSTEFLKIVHKWYLGLVLSSLQGDGSPGGMLNLPWMKEKKLWFRQLFIYLWSTP